MKLSSFFFLVLVLFFSLSGFLFWHLDRLFEFGGEKTTNLLSEISSFTKKSVVENDKIIALENQYLKALSQGEKDIAVNAKLPPQARESIILQNQIVNFEKKVIKNIEELSLEISNDLRPKLNVEKNETVDFLKLQIPEHLQSGFEDLFNVQRLKNSDLSLYVVTDKLLDDLNQLLGVAKSEYQFSETRLEYLYKINLHRFDRIQKLKIRHFLKLKANRLKKSFTSVIIGVKNIMQQRQFAEQLKTAVLEQFQNDRVSQEMASVESLQLTANKFKERFVTLGRELKQSLISAIGIFTLLLFGTIIFFYRMVSSPIQQLLDPQRTSSTPLLKEIQDLLKRLRKQQNDNLALQSELIKKEKLAVMGGIVNMIAHELKNPLAIMRLTIDDLKENVQQDSREDIQRLDEMLERMKDQIKNLNQFAMVRDSREMINLENLVRKVSNLFQPLLLKQGIQLQVLSEQDVSIKSISSYLEIIFINLIGNSVQALKNIDRGQIQITIRPQRDQDEVLIEFVDNGVGVPADSREKVFDAYFSTKEGESGAGLGLHIVQSLLTQINGRIHLEHNESEEGAKFMIYLATLEL